jgi:hypothetical protein
MRNSGALSCVAARTDTVIGSATGSPSIESIVGISSSSTAHASDANARSGSFHVSGSPSTGS